MATAEVIVRGAGIIGLSVAWELRRLGASVLVVDPDGAGSGASGGIVGALAPHVPEGWNAKKQFQFESLDMAGGFWSEVSEVSGMSPGYVRAGRVQPIADGAAEKLARARGSGAEELWGGRYNWEITDDPGPFAPLSPSGLWVRDDLSAHIHPRRAVAALAAALDVRGVPVVSAAEPGDAEVWATGWRGLVSLTNALGWPVGDGVKGQAALLLPKRPPGLSAQIFTGSLHVIPHLDGTVAVGSTTERDWTAPVSADATVAAELAAEAEELVPALRGAEIIGRWAGVRPRAAGRAPLLDRHPLREGVWIANGGFKIGFGMAPKIGRVVAEAVLGLGDEIPNSFRMTPWEA